MRTAHHLDSKQQIVDSRHQTADRKWNVARESSVGREEWDDKETQGEKR
jgi:hypothetical protein